VALTISRTDSSSGELSSRFAVMTAWLTGLSSVAILFSIAASQILLGAALACLLISRRPLDFPPRLGLPLVAYAVWTLLALGFSDAPVAGVSQVRKLFVFFVIVVVVNGFQNQKQIWRTVQGVLIGGVAAAIFGLGQFGSDYLTLAQQGRRFYENYIVHQITGFMSHWMTYGGELMVVLLLLLAIILFATDCGKKHWRWLGAFLLCLALLGAFTRGIWIGTLAGVTFLVGYYRRWMVGLIPVALLLLYLISPSWLQERDRSIFNPEAESSGMARLVMLRTGLRMIRAHPVFGLGPERVGPLFRDYVPEGTTLPPAWYGHLHNTFLQIAAERGIPCVFILVWFFYEVFHDNVLRARCARSKERALACAASASTVAILVAGLFEYNLGDSEVLMLYLFVISLPYAWNRHQPAPAQPA